MDTGTVLTGMFCQAVLADNELTEKQKAAYRQVIKQEEDSYGSYTLRNDTNIQYAGRRMLSGIGRILIRMVYQNF